MKAKLKSTRRIGNTTIQEGTEVKIIKGMEADAADVLNTPEGMCYLCEHEGNMFYVPAELLTITDWSNIDWEKRRYEIAKEAMAATMSSWNLLEQILYKNAKMGQMQIHNFISKVAVMFADALIEELKKKAE